MERINCKDYESLRSARTKRLFGRDEQIGSSKQIMVGYAGCEPNGTLRLRFGQQYVAISNIGDDHENAYSTTDPESLFWAMHKVLKGHELYFIDINTLHDFIKHHGTAYPKAVRHLLDHPPEYLFLMVGAREVGLEGEWGYVLSTPLNETLNDIEGKIYT